MKVTCQRDSLQTACSLVATAVAARTTKPILSNVKAVAEDDRLTLIAYDTEVGIRYDLRGIQVGRSGAAILPITHLTQILREHSDAEISLDANDEGTEVRIGTSRYTMASYPVDEFPDVPSFDDDGRYHEINSGVLHTMIRRTQFAADKKESTRFALSGVLWEAEGKQAKLVATDSKRLAVCTGAATLFGPTETTKASHLVPDKTIKLLMTNLTDEGELVRIALRPNEALFQTERWTIYTRLVEGRYPPYKDIIPKKSEVKLPLPSALFLSKVRQAAIMTDDETKRVDLTFTVGKLTLQAHGAETGSSNVEMPIEGFEGNDITIAFDPSYLVEFLRAIDGEPTVMLEITNGEKPALFRVGESYLYLVMPLAG